MRQGRIELEELCKTETWRKTKKEREGGIREVVVGSVRWDREFGFRYLLDNEGVVEDGVRGKEDGAEFWGVVADEEAGEGLDEVGRRR